uniref:Uncharacterized protein n=1 Tax=Rhizophora mucronata TaxID=61149 RepID=A0A2P2QGX9_RHIMU
MGCHSSNALFPFVCFSFSFLSTSGIFSDSIFWN